MHEFGFCEGIVDAVRRRAIGRIVKRLRVRIGVLHGLDERAFQQAFSLAANGTEAEGAIFEMIFIPAKAYCRGCRNEFEAGNGVPVCARCGGIDVEVSGGDDLVLESLEYEIPAKRTSE